MKTKTFITIITIAIIAWFVLSWVEVCCKNLGSADYSNWNMVAKFVEILNNK